MGDQCSSDGKCDKCLANKGIPSQPTSDGYMPTIEAMQRMFVEEEEEGRFKVFELHLPGVGQFLWIDCPPIFNQDGDPIQYSRFTPDKDKHET